MTIPRMKHQDQFGTDVHINRWAFSVQNVAVFTGILVSVMTLGCGGGESGPARFSVSGKVTYQGQPIPNGFIMFTPDPGKGNSGPATGAPIVNGAYATEAGKGTIGGPHRVEITGFDGIPFTEEGEELKDGKPLFPPYQTSADLPKQKTEMNFDVPAQEAS